MNSRDVTSSFLCCFWSVLFTSIVLLLTTLETKAIFFWFSWSAYYSRGKKQLKAFFCSLFNLRKLCTENQTTVSYSSEGKPPWLCLKLHNLPLSASSPSFTRALTKILFPFRPQSRALHCHLPFIMLLQSCLEYCGKRWQTQRFDSFVFASQECCQKSP